MKRYGMIIGIKPDKLAEYKKHHANVWPEVLEMIEKCHIKNYSIFHKNNQLFSYFEYHGVDYEKDMAKMAKDKKTREWWSIMGPLQEPLPDRKESEWWVEMEEVFHTD